MKKNKGFQGISFTQRIVSWNPFAVLTIMLCSAENEWDKRLFADLEIIELMLKNDL